MGIAKEQEIKTILKASGILVEIDDDGLHIEDEKEGTIETLSLDDFRIFTGDSIKITIVKSTKSTFEDDEGK